MKMAKLKPVAMIAFTLCVLVVTSCASAPTTHTTVLGSWKLDNFNKKLSNFLVISLSEEPGIRGKVESIQAERLKQAGLSAMASSDIMPPGEEISRRTVKAAMSGKDFDGVLVTHLLGVDSGAVYVPPSPDTSFESSFNSNIPMVVSPGRVEYRSVISLQIDLYDRVTEHLVWSLKSQSVNADNVDAVVNALTDVVIKDLRIKNLI